MERRKSPDWMGKRERMSMDVRLTKVYAEKALEPIRDEMKWMFRRAVRAFEAMPGASSFDDRYGVVSVFAIIERRISTVANMAVFRTCQSNGNVTRSVSGVRNVASSEGSISDNLFRCHAVSNLPEKATSCSSVSNARPGILKFSIACAISLDNGPIEDTRGLEPSLCS